MPLKRLNSPDGLHQAVLHAFRHCYGAFEAILPEMNAVVFAKDKDGCTIFFNEAYTRVLLSPIDQIFGKTDFEMFPEAFARQYRNNDRIIGETLQKQEFIELVQFEDCVRAYRSIKFPLLDGHGALIGTAGLAVPHPSAAPRPTTKDPSATLSDRERYVLKHVALGITNRAIAHELGISVKSVESYRLRLMRKLGLRDRAALVTYALQAAFITTTN